LPEDGYFDVCGVELDGDCLAAGCWVGCPMSLLVRSRVWVRMVLLRRVLCTMLCRMVGVRRASMRSGILAVLCLLCLAVSIRVRSGLLRRLLVLLLTMRLYLAWVMLRRLVAGRSRRIPCTGCGRPRCRLALCSSLLALAGMAILRACFRLRWMGRVCPMTVLLLCRPIYLRRYRRLGRSLIW
jgi:hypothetical protein